MRLSIPPSSAQRCEPRHDRCMCCCCVCCCCVCCCCVCCCCCCCCCCCYRPPAGITQAGLSVLSAGQHCAAHGSALHTGSSRLSYDGANFWRDTSSSMSLADSFLQQLDLLQHFAGAMSHTTHRIWQLQGQAGSDVLAAQLADSAYDLKKDWGPRNSSLQQLYLQAQPCTCAIDFVRQHAAVKGSGDSDYGYTPAAATFTTSRTKPAHAAGWGRPPPPHQTHTTGEGLDQ